MPGFSYKVIDMDGRERKGNINAPSVEQVKKRLTAEGLIIVEVEEIELFGSDSLFGRGRITDDDLADFCNQFVHMYKSGIGTVNVLKMMAEQTQKKKMNNIINFLADQTGEGVLLYEAMVNADVFPQPLVAAIEAGELSGCMIDNMEKMGSYYEKLALREESLKKSVVYPSFIMGVILIVIAGVLIFVVPGFMGMIGGFDIVIPLSTKVTVGLSRLLTKFWWIILVLLAVVFAGLGFAKRSRTGRVFRSRFRINYKGAFQRKSLDDCASFSRLMSTLLSAGIPLIKALELSGNSYQDHVIFRRAILKIKDKVSAGASLSKSLEAEIFFPKLFVNMIAVGEETGRLNEMFENAAEYYEKEFENAVRKLTAILEPVLVILLAIILGFIVISLLRPLLALYEAVGNM